MKFHRFQQLLLAPISILLLTVVAYFPAMNAGYVVDDAVYILQDRLMTLPGGLWRIWFAPQDNNGVWPYLPIARTSFWLEYRLWGWDPMASHIVNIGLHVLSALLLWRILHQLRISGAWWIAAFFLLHPIHVQSVAWLTERKNVLSGVFYLLTFWAWLRYQRQPTVNAYLLALVCFLAALLSKTSTVMLPALLVLLMLWRKQKLSWKMSGHLLPFFALSGATAYVRVWFELYSFGANRPELELSFLERLINAGKIPFFYIGKLIFPYPLMFHYPKWDVDPTMLSNYWGLFLGLVIAGLCYWKYSTWGRSLAFGLGAYLITLFPVMGFFNNAFTRFSYVADHWIYLPSIPLIMLGVGSVFRYYRIKLIEKRRQDQALYQIRITAPLLRSTPFGWAMILIFALVTWWQTQHYWNEVTFWEHTLKNNPESWLAHNNLGKWYLDNALWDEAREHLDQAILINPRYWKAYLNRGSINLLQNRLQDAITDWSRAIAIDPRGAQAYHNRGVAYLESMMYEQALADFNQALNIDPNLVLVYRERGSTYNALGNTELACADWRRACEFDLCALWLQSLSTGNCR